jgi:predicted metal-dependent hydrolase
MAQLVKTYRQLIPPIGLVNFQRRRRTRNINIFVEPFKDVRVSFPYWVALKEAEAFVRSHIKWIQKKQREMKQEEKKYSPQQDLFSTINKEAAKKAIIQRTQQLAQQFGFSYKRITIRNQKTRWGSCSRDNQLSLNLKLVKLPDRLRDYVILHELVHTRIKSHGKNFWAILNSVIDKAKLLDRQLGKCQLDLL